MRAASRASAVAQAVGKNASSAAPRIAPPKNQGSASASRPMKLSKITSKLIQYSRERMQQTNEQIDDRADGGSVWLVAVTANNYAVASSLVEGGSGS